MQYAWMRCGIPPRGTKSESLGSINVHLEIKPRTKRTRDCQWLVKEYVLNTTTYGTYGHSHEVLLVAGEGFEPSKAEPGDLQSPPIGRSGNPPGSNK